MRLQARNVMKLSFLKFRDLYYLESAKSYFLINCSETKHLFLALYIRSRDTFCKAQFCANKHHIGMRVIQITNCISKF